MEITCRIPIKLSTNEVDHIVLQRLEDLTFGQWVGKNGRVREEYHGSHSFESDSDEQHQTPERVNILLAMKAVRDHIKKLKSS